MSSRRILTIINLSIAVLLVLFLFAAFWYAYRPLPKNSGEIPAPIAGNASIVRDSLGVPHITASTLEDALFLQGYVTAEDRMWQMDALRRLAAGDLAEVVGRRALQSDEEARRLRMRGTRPPSVRPSWRCRKPGALSTSWLWRPTPWHHERH